MGLLHQLILAGICGMNVAVAVASAVEISTRGSERENLRDYPDGDHESNFDTANAETDIIQFPKMPPVLRSILHEDWKGLGVADILERLKSPGVLEFAHGRGTFYSHLSGTYSILKAWGQPDDICLLGMTHTAYGGDLFQFFLWDSLNDRQSLQSLIGKDAETLTYLFGTINRGQLGALQDIMSKEISEMAPLVGNFTVKHRVEGTKVVPARTAAKILLVTVADYLDQMVEQNGWRDHHQVEFAVDRLYPGDGRPTTAFYWFSQVCHSIRDVLDVVPPIFDSCTQTISYQEEVIARDLYWNATLSEYELTEAQQMDLLYQAISHNPIVGEPHILLSQIYFRNKQYQRAGQHCRIALQKLYTLASAWDKRRSYAQWVGFSRVLLLRSNRYLEGKTHMPYFDEENGTYDTAKGLHLTSLHDLAKEMRDYEES